MRQPSPIRVPEHFLLRPINYNERCLKRPTRAGKNSQKVVKLCENADRAFEQVQRARFVRRRPHETQRVAPNVALLLIRARYYDPTTGEFTSRDPLEYVDGMSLYRAYFVPGGMDPFGESATLAGCGLGFVGGVLGSLGGNAYDILSGDISPGQACCRAACGGIGGCIGGAAIGATVDFGVPVLAPYAGCIGGAIGSLFTSWCEAKCRGDDWNPGQCELGSAMIAGVIGCIGGVAQGIDDGVRELIFILMGTNASVYGSLCDGGGPGPRVGKACCTFSSNYGSGKPWTETIDCPLGRTPFGCCRERATGWWNTWNVLDAKAGKCN